MTEVVFESGLIKAERMRLAGGESTRWQRCPVADRVLVVQDGSGFCRRGYGVEAGPEEIGPGDVIHVLRMKWHRIAAAPDEELAVALVTTQPADVEYRS